MDPPPAQQGPARPRAKSSFSLHSDKSRDKPSSPGKSPKSPKHERKASDSDKRKTHYDINTKANPNAAMNEIQPIAAALEKPTLQSLRSFQHSDSAGNVIVDPDLSNPTRSRWERPLDTIRSFEAAIDGEYRRRAQTTRGDQSEVMSGYTSRRSSYYGGGPDHNRYSQASNYPHNNRQPGRDSYDGYGGGGPVGGPQRVRYNSRMQSDPGYNRGAANNVYPQNGYQQSRDTVNTNGSNGSHSDGLHSNEPGSENSSIERGVPVRPPQQHDTGDLYGYSGFQRGPIMEEYGGGQGPPQQGGYFPPPQQSNGVPPPPPKHVTPSAPIKLGSSGPPVAGANRPPITSKNSEEKRRSWFKRRFSKE